MKVKIQDIADICDGRVVRSGNAMHINNVSINSKYTGKGQLFIAISGQNHDGHDFIEEAVRAGAGAVIVNEDKVNEVSGMPSLNGTACISVSNTLDCVKKLASGYRDSIKFKKVIAITGSNGKTTTKDLLQSIIRKKHTTCFNEGNRNNELGLPLTILSARTDCQVMILEMAMRGPGQIAELCQIAKPHWGVITNIGQSHMEFLGSEEKVAEAKGELARYLKADGTLFLNADDKWSNTFLNRTKAEIVTFGVINKSDVQASEVHFDINKTSFNVQTKNDSFEVEIPCPGLQFVYSGLAAIAVSLMLGLEPKFIVNQLKSAKVSPMRMQVVDINGTIYLNDAYNASPSSMEMALDSLAKLKSGRKIAVLGDMMELGKQEADFHYAVGSLVGKNKLDYLFTFGNLSKFTFQGALENGLAKERAFHFQDRKELAEKLKKLIRKGDIVLIKASRSIELDKVLGEVSGDGAK